MEFSHAFNFLMTKGEDVSEEIARKQRIFVAPFRELHTQYKETMNDLVA